MLATAQPYAAATIYTFAYNCASNGYSLTINGTIIASNITYAASRAVPAYYKIEQSSGGTGYVGVTQRVMQASSRKD